MRNVLRATCIGLGATLALFLVSIAAYDFLAIRPGVQHLREILSGAAPGDRHPTANVRAFLDAGRGRGVPVEASAARLLLWRLHAGEQPSLGTRFVQGLVWPKLIRLHVSREDLYAVECTLSWNGIDHGLEPLARRRFGRPMAALTNHEAAELVAITTGPATMLRHPNLLAKRTARLLAAAGGL